MDTASSELGVLVSIGLGAVLTMLFQRIAKKTAPAEERGLEGNKYMSNCVHWIFGRGSSIGCNLKWIVPKEWKSLPRDEKISKIKKSILIEMESEQVDTSSFKLFLARQENLWVNSGSGSSPIVRNSAILRTS